MLFQNIVRNIKRLLRLSIVEKILYLPKKKGNNIVIHQFKLIYVPIPKVASRSLKLYFKNLLNINSLSLHSGHFPSVREKEYNSFYKDYFKFAFVRNPYERLVASYETKLNLGVNMNYPIYRDTLINLSLFLPFNLPLKILKYPILKESMSFTDFIKSISEIPDEYLDKHIRSQYSFLFDSQGKCVVDFIGHIETINEDFCYICKKVNLQDTELPHEKNKEMNTIERKSYKSYYSIETWDIVKKRFAQDVEIFGYGHLDFEE